MKQLKIDLGDIPKNENYVTASQKAKWGKALQEYCDTQAQTVGQFTGLCDKNGEKVFEGDIVRYSPNLSNMGKVLDTVGVIAWHECGMFVINGHSYWDIGHIFNSECKEWAEIIGNIHDNPELLEESKNE